MGDPEITLSEEDGIRYLHFGTPWVQGAMRIARPDELALSYLERMMGWLLFLRPPSHVLQLGLGAGGLTRYAHRHLKLTQTTVVEHSPRVIATARQWFKLPDDDERLRVIRADAAQFLSRPEVAGRYGVIQVDLYDEDARGPVYESSEFFAACHRALAEPGILVLNLFGRTDSFARNLRRVSSVFDTRLVSFAPVSAGNCILLAFKGPELRVPVQAISARARLVARHYRLPDAHLWPLALRDSKARPLPASGEWTV